MWVICSWFEQIARIKRAIHSKKLYFCMFLTVFSLFTPKSSSLLLLFPRSLFGKQRLDRFAPVALYKRATWAIRSGHSWQKSDHERFAQVAHDHDKRVTGAISFFSWANRSFAHKKWGNQKTDEQIPNPNYLRHKKNLGVCTKMMWKDAAAPVLLSLD